MPADTNTTRSTGLHVGEIRPGVPKVDPIIVADNVTRSFGGLKAVDVDHVEIPRNAITALIGPNGAGKTTFFNLLTGFDKPDTGEWSMSRVNTVVDVSQSPPARLDERLAALVIDLILENLILALGVLSFLSGALSANPAPGIFFGVLLSLFWIALLIYQVGLTATRGQTIGKSALRLKVLSVTTTPGSPIGWPRAIGRFLVLRLVSSIAVIGFIAIYLSPLWDSSGRNRGWHDRIVGSEVFALESLVTHADLVSGPKLTSLVGIPAFKSSLMGQVRTFQLTKALSMLTVLENMKLGARDQSGENFFTAMLPWLWRKQDDEIEQKALELLKRFKLDTKQDDFAASLSGGQRKLLEMARALMSDPTLVMLDEPMAGVNPALTQSLLDHILGLKADGMTVLFVEHDMQMVRHISDWVIVMAEGRIVAEGPPDDVMKNTAVIDAYLGSHMDTDLGVVTGRIETVATPKKEKKS